MFNLDTNFGNPTMAFTQNIMAASTNHFLDDRVDLETLKEMVAGGTKYIAHLTSLAGVQPEKINETIAIVQGANRALMLRTILRGAVIDINDFTASLDQANAAADTGAAADKTAN